MKQEIIFTVPVFKQTVWGGDRLGKIFGYDIPGSDTGECWAISTHPGGESIIKGGSFDGMKLSEVWRKNPGMFGGTTPEQALLTKYIDARQDLSVQVHPDDAYAGEHENGALGKTEFWYVLDCDPDATIIVGHNARTREELESMVREGSWKELLREIPIHRGDGFFIAPGTVHAIKGGTLIAEIQQTSNITYRLYDYDRLSNGKKRELHTEKSLDVIRVPFDPALMAGDCAGDGTPRILCVMTADRDAADGTPVAPGDALRAEKGACAGTRGRAVITMLVTCDKFTVWRICSEGKNTFTQENRFLEISVTDGEGTIDGHHIVKGDNLILPAGYGEWTVDGRLELICSCV